MSEDIYTKISTYRKVVSMDIANSLSIEHVVKGWPFRERPLGWRESEWQAVAGCKTLAELGELSHRVMNQLPRPIALVSGPISTGGILKPGMKGESDIRANLDLFNKVVQTLLLGGVSLFNQMPLEDIFVPINTQWKAVNPPGSYCMPILEEFYRDVFAFPGMRGIILIPDWQSSFGAKWEVKEANSKGKHIIDLPKGWETWDEDELCTDIRLKLAY
jgi:hypothetical protein